MSYKNFQRERWDSLAREFGDIKPLRAVISYDDEVNYYCDMTTKGILGRCLRLEHKRVLDLGCGIGRLTLWMARKAEHVTGVDVSEEMIRVARSAAAAQRLHNVAFQVSDMATVALHDASFDIIVCSAVLKYIIDENEFSIAIGKMCRAVVPGGRVAVIDEFDYDGAIELGEEDIGGRSLLRRPTDYIALFRTHGLELVEQWSILRWRIQWRFRKLERTLLAKLPFGRFIATRPLVAHIMAMVDVRLDIALRRRVKPVRGFQLLSFVRSP
jgi:SAM-dependent methyltransferase